MVILRSFCLVGLRTLWGDCSRVDQSNDVFHAAKRFAKASRDSRAAIQSLLHPSVVAAWTDDFVYDRLAPGLTEELRTKNPIVDTGRRTHKHHQWFNPERGHPRLKEHISGAIALLRAAETWGTFKKGLDRAYPKFGKIIEMALTGGDGATKRLT